MPPFVKPFFRQGRSPLRVGQYAVGARLFRLLFRKWNESIFRSGGRGYSGGCECGGRLFSVRRIGIASPADDEGCGDLVVPPLLPAVKGDPEEAEAEEGSGDQVANPPQELSLIHI